MPLANFHPAVATWFSRTFGGPTEPQARGWPSIRAGRHTLIAAPTGSGKTLSAFLCAIDDLVRRGLEGELEDAVSVVYVSPLKALSNDIETNLQRPLAGIREVLAEMGLPDVAIRTAVRTGDTPASERTSATKRPPHIYVTTPESLAILLTSEGGRRILQATRTVIVDEIHALVRDKRGSHLALSLERLATLVEGFTASQGNPRSLLRVGLSATQKPIEEVARFLVGSANVDADGMPKCTIVDAGHRRTLDVAIEVPKSPLEAVMALEVWEEVYDRMAELVREHRTTLVFVNTRRVAERVARHLSDRLGEDAVTSHHGSLSRAHRLNAERRLRAGELRALVATASLELGIDIGDVDLVCQIGSPRSIAAFLQRVGRAGHHLGGVPKGRLFPQSRDELVESVALLDSVRRGELDRLILPEEPLDILAQHLVAATAAEEWDEDALYAVARRAWPFRNLERATFDAVIRMLVEGYRTGRGPRARWLHHDAVHRKLRGRKGARLAVITSGGAIPDNADYDVLLEPTGLRVGSVNEDWAIESMAGDVFQLGNTSYRILNVSSGKVRVEDAHGEPPSLPFWLGEAPARTVELSAAVARIRKLVDDHRDSIAEATRALVDSAGIDAVSAAQTAEYLGAACRSLDAMPTQETIVLERFFDETGSMHLVLHAPFGMRVNRAWGLALRKRFCRRFNIELQAAATDDAVVLSLGPSHSFPLEDVFAYLRSATVRDLLVQAMLDSPLFATRFRWNASRALAILRFRGGRKVAPQIQRMESEDLLGAVFPDQVACFENLAGERRIPDHPLVQQTIHDCLEEAMDITALEAILARIEHGDLRCVARDRTEPSPLAQEILTARPYAFLDDAPLEERRTQAVRSRRWLDPETAADVGALDPEAILRVKAEAFPEARTPDELHEALVFHAALTEQEGRFERPSLDESVPDLTPFFAALERDRRAARLALPSGALWIAAERLPEFRAVHPSACADLSLVAPSSARTPSTREDAIREIVRGRLDALGPVTARELAHPLGLAPEDVLVAVAALEAEGSILRGRFRPQAEEDEFCERGLLARIHRYTLGKLRAEIEPVATADFVRFLVHWQGAETDTRLEGAEGLFGILERLEGYEAAASSWESDLLALRMRGYDPSWLDQLCMSGRVAWARRTPGSGTSGPVRSTPIAILPREHVDIWLDPLAREAPLEEASADAREVHRALAERGATFFAELQRRTGILPTRLEEALGELVSLGLVASDGFSGLRALLVPASRRSKPHPLRRRGRPAVIGMESAGRWSLLSTGTVASDARWKGQDIEHVARVLLRRWGVVFRRVLDRESSLPPWRDLLSVYRRLEARGEARGGRFVSGYAGEQFALPDAVTTLRRLRKTPPAGALLSITASDPLNLVGILTPGRRIAAIPKNRVLLRDGVPVAARDGSEVRFLDETAEETRWELETALLRRPGREEKMLSPSGSGAESGRKFGIASPWARRPSS